MIHFVYVWCVIVFLVMVPKYVIDVAIIWLNDNIYSRNTWFPTTDVQTQNIGKPRYANRRAPTECRHTIATQATEYQRWRDVSCRSRRCRPMPTLGQRRNASWVVKIWHQMDDSSFLQRCQFCMLAMYNGYMHKCICVYLYDYANQMYVYILWIYLNIHNCTPWSVNVLINRPMQWSHCHSTNSAAWVPEMHTHNIWN